MVFCFVSKKGLPGLIHFGSVSADIGRHDQEYFKFEFDPEKRKMLIPDRETDKPDHRHIKVAMEFFQNIFGNPARLMSMVNIIRLSKPDLAQLLNPNARKIYFEICAEIERSLTLVCTSNRETNCLASGCSVEGAEGICLEACLSAPDNAYANSYTKAWLELFKNPANRIEVWKK